MVSANVTCNSNMCAVHSVDSEYPEYFLCMCNILWADPKCDLSHSIAEDHRHCFHHICFCRLWSSYHHNLIKITIDIAPRTSKHTNHIHRITYWSHVDDRNSPPGWSSHGIKAQGTIHMASRQITQYKAHVGEAASPPAKICQTHLADSHRWLDDRCNHRVAQASNSLWVLSSERSSSRYHHRRHQLFSFYSKNKCHTNGVTPYWCC